MIRITTSFRPGDIAPPIGAPIKTEDGKIVGQVTGVDMSRHEWFGEVEDHCRNIITDKNGYMSIEIKIKEKNDEKD